MTNKSDTRTPAPVTEGAQREAVASPFVFNEELSAKLQGLRADMPKEAKAALVRESIALLREHQNKIDPLPPDRGQPERVEAGEFVLLPRDPTGRMWAAFDDVCDVTLNQFRSGYKAMLAAAPAPPPPDRVQPERVEALSLENANEVKRGVARTSLADVASHTAAVADLGADRSVQMQIAPPTDASGVVTEPLNELLMDAIDSLDEGGFKDVANRLHAQFDRIEAADRARKPGYRQVTLDDAVAFLGHYVVEHRRKSDNESVLAALKAIGAVIPDAGRGEK